MNLCKILALGGVLAVAAVVAGPAMATYAQPSAKAPTAPAGVQQAIAIDFIGGEFCVLQRGGSNRSGTDWSQWDCFPAR